MANADATAAANVGGAKAGLILTGGGARAAYQVGVLKAVRELLPEPDRNPFQIICGTSAGAINAAALAVNADNFDQAVGHLLDVWENFHVHHVYRSDFSGIAASGAASQSVELVHWLAVTGRRVWPAVVAVAW